MPVTVSLAVIVTVPGGEPIGAKEVQLLAAGEVGEAEVIGHGSALRRFCRRDRLSGGCGGSAGPAVRARLDELGLRTWTTAVVDVYVRLRPTIITGRRLRPG